MLDVVVGKVLLVDGDYLFEEIRHVGFFHEGVPEFGGCGGVVLFVGGDDIGHHLVAQFGHAGEFHQLANMFDLCAILGCKTEGGKE
ncbi:hypothetical protein ACQ86N_04715 [Puia sp. P3]|uniref:hypothetical protein n=1 Tax=Puia sp. P3 TaxID=3423952 RepID=UPI003D663D37